MRKIKNKKYINIIAVIVLVLAMVLAIFSINKKILPSPSCSDANSTPEYYYDGNGTLIKIDYGTPCVDYGIKSVNYWYDTNGNLVKELNIIKLNDNYYSYSNTYNYDTNGNLLGYNSPSQSKVYKYSDNKLVKEMQGNYITSYDYDEQNRTSCINCEASASDMPIIYSYDENNSVTNMSVAGKTFYQTFDSEGKLASKSDEAGNSASYQYDENGSLTGIKDSGFFGQDLNVNRCGSFDNYIYDENCTLLADDVYSYTYDENGSTARKTSLADNSFCDYSYTGNFEISRITCSDGNYAEYFYGTGGVYKFQDSIFGTAYLSPFDYSTMMNETDLISLLTSCSSPNECGEIATSWSCSDGVQNGYEEGVDCGISCWNECENKINYTGALSLYYNFNNNVLDSSGNSYDGVNSGGLFVLGVNGQAVSFDGNSYITTLFNNITGSQARTLSIWINALDNNFTDAVALTDGACGAGRLRFETYESGNAGKIVFEIGNAQVCDGYVLSNAVISNTGWHNIVGVYDGISSYLYVDGILQASSATSIIPLDSANSAIGAVSSADWAISSRFNGKIDELKIYNYALSSSDILQEYNINKPVCNENKICDTGETQENCPSDCASACIPGSYIISNAGNESVNGEYISYSTNNGAASYKHKTNDIYIYKFCVGNNCGGNVQHWNIGPVHNGYWLDSYYDYICPQLPPDGHTDETCVASVHLGSYSLVNNGVAPNPVVSACT